MGRSITKRHVNREIKRTEDQVDVTYSGKTALTPTILGRQEDH